MAAWRRPPPARSRRAPADALDALETQLRALGGRTALIAVTGASNVTGEVWPIEEIAGLAHRHGSRVVLDAAQLAAHRPIDITAWGVDYVAFSGHKVYAPYGAGVLAGPADWLDRARPHLAGGGAVRNVTVDGVEWTTGPARHEGGTPAALGAVAIAAAVRALRATGWERIQAHAAAVGASRSRASTRSAACAPTSCGTAARPHRRGELQRRRSRSPRCSRRPSAPSTASACATAPSAPTRSWSTSRPRQRIPARRARKHRRRHQRAHIDRLLRAVERTRPPAARAGTTSSAAATSSPTPTHVPRPRSEGCSVARWLRRGVGVSRSRCSPGTLIITGVWVRSLRRGGRGRCWWGRSGGKGWKPRRSHPSASSR